MGKAWLGWLSRSRRGILNVPPAPTYAQSFGSKHGCIRRYGLAGEDAFLKLLLAFNV